MDGFRTAYVYVRDVYAGALSETDAGYAFAYDPHYLAQADPAPVSLTLPLRAERFTSTTLFPFFDGLIPEEGARNALKVMARFDPAVVAGKIAIASTYTNEFARKAKDHFKV